MPRLESTLTVALPLVVELMTERSTGAVNEAAVTAPVVTADRVTVSPMPLPDTAVT
jgi:hypothetical protein